MRLWKLFLAGMFMAIGATAVAAPGEKSFKDCVNCPVVVAVPPGSFMMGMTKEEEVRRGMPAPQAGKPAPVHQVTFAKGFAIGKYPVTVAEFRSFVDETGYRAADSCYTQHKVDGHFIYEEVHGYSWRSPGFEQTDLNPVVCVSGLDGEAYAAWLSKKTGHNYTLPNEAQYEYAARAGTTTAYFWGDARDATACEYSNQPDLDQAKALGNVPTGPQYRFQCHDGYGYTAPVGSYKPNPWGLYDMLGNIWEWTADCWHDNMVGAPADGSTWKTGDCDARSSRGGSFGNAVFSTYAAVRAPRAVGYVGHAWGFRVVRND
jgi:formylglycine-generating enzyme required for sulfatase activity